MTGGAEPRRGIVVAVAGPVGPTVPGIPGLVAYRVLRPHPDEPSPHPESVGGVVLVGLADDAPVPAAAAVERWFDAPVAAYRTSARRPVGGPPAPGDHRATPVPTPGVVQCSFVRRLPSLTRSEFAAHWRGVHAPLVPVHHPGVARYEQHVVIEPLTAGAPEVDGIAVLAFPTATDFHDRYYDSEAGRRIVAADVARFIDRPRGWRLHARETVHLEEGSTPS